MTAAARITQADINRAVRAARKAGDDVRVIVGLANGRLEILVGKAANAPTPNPFDEE